MSDIKTLHFINNDDLFVPESKTLYISFSEILNKVLQQRGVKSKYLFLKSYDQDLKKEIDSISKCLNLESNKYNDKRWFNITFKFIYKYLPIYNHFYDNIKAEIKLHNNLKYIKISNKLPHLCKDILIHIASTFKIEVIYTNERFSKFSDYPYFLGTDLPEPENIDKHNIFIYLIAKYLRFKHHNTFISPSVVKLDIPKNVNIFKTGYLTIIFKFFSKIFNYRNSNFSKYIPSINFNRKTRIKYTIDNKIWVKFRDDQKIYIEKIINIILNKYSNNYIDLIESKIRLLFIVSGTKKIIVDDTFEILKRIMIIVANDLSIDIEFLPHGIVYEDEHLNVLKDWSAKTKVLAWTDDSKDCFMSNDIIAQSIKYPINTSNNKKKPKKDILILFSGGKYTVNNFEKILTAFLENKSMDNLQIDWKYHQSLDLSQQKVMNEQLVMIKEFYNKDISLINNKIKLVDIMADYRILGFTTWTTGIFEAALSNMPFFIYTKEPYNIHAFDSIDMPIARCIDDCISMLEVKNHKYLYDIQKSINNNPAIF
tara:strand:- start:610 stop:2226 length:1617 start_codon:yes stop_codon:yes gene_type:complete